MPSPPIDFDASPTGDEPEGVRAARAFLAGGAPPTALADDVIAALVHALTERSDVVRLSELATTADKPLAKSARRGLHLLRTRGVAAAIPSSSVKASLSSSTEIELPSLMSAVLRDGERMIWFVGPPEEKSGIPVYQVRTSDLDGMTEFGLGLPTRREWREAEQELMLDRNLSVVRVAGSYARWLVEESYLRTLEAGLTPPREFAEVRHQLAKAVAPPRHPALDRVPLRSFSDDQLLHVLELPETRTWIPDEKIARKTYQELEQLSVSQIVLDEKQRREQARELVRRAGEEALSGPWRSRLTRRLLDTALVIASLPERGAHQVHHDRTRDHLNDAALCIAASQQVEDAKNGIEQAVVARALFDRLLPKQALSDEPANLPDKGGLIITP